MVLPHRQSAFPCGLSGCKPGNAWSRTRHHFPPKPCSLPHIYHLCLFMSEEPVLCPYCDQSICSDGTLPSDTGNNTDPSASSKPTPRPFRPASVYLAVLFLQHGVKEAGVGHKGQRWPLSLLFQEFAHCVPSCWQCQRSHLSPCHHPSSTWLSPRVP